MLKWLLLGSVRKMERKYRYDATYLHEMAGVSEGAFVRFAIVQLAGGGFRAEAPANAWFAAGIGGALVEDCGPCVQIASDIAMEEGMNGEIIKKLLSGAPADDDAQLGFDYGRALLLASPNLDELRETIERKWGRKALLALTLRAMTARNFPVLKRAMGHAKACQRVRIGNDDVAVNQSLKAA
ncbi:MAG TPA: hypothetical protein VG891_14220 [Rhizomicrobium sp.]|nr:hypothetical protein [Rhizomicrobium sp.]